MVQISSHGGGSEKWSVVTYYLLYLVVALTQRKEKERTLAQRFLCEEKNRLNVAHRYLGNDWLPG